MSSLLTFNGEEIMICGEDIINSYHQLLHDFFKIKSFEEANIHHAKRMSLEKLIYHYDYECLN